ncbi:glutamate synthase large subunit [Alloscardovia venturai]|uniref:Glutamate synthase large subunit n=1 Tax=Alloscardovia venturai TaxID=1769421 RepID=A0ABW2Y9H9_9BIFI
MTSLDLTVQSAQGLYDSRFEHDACGVGMVTTLNKQAERRIVDNALEVLENLDHRGAVGAEENTGDGAGIMMSMPDEFLREVFDVELPHAGSYAAGIAFLDRDIATAGKQQQEISRIAACEGLDTLAWRVVPTNPADLGLQALAGMPSFYQVIFVDNGGASDSEYSEDSEKTDTSREKARGKMSGLALDRVAYRIRKRVEHEVGVYFASLSTRMMTYKGMLTTSQLSQFFPDLNSMSMKARVAIVHSRFSTNTFPSWPLAQPFRMIAHNGEINTIQGNRNWLSARSGSLKSELLGEMADLLPLDVPGNSDSGTFDETLELLNLAGRSIPHAVLMMLPPAWENNPDLDPDVRAFYEYNNTLIEPWDGPANIVFSDGRYVGAQLDRNGFRPGRWQLDRDGYLVLASEAGVLPEIPQDDIVLKGRLEPGTMFLVDTQEGRIVPDEEIKKQLASEHPYAQWMAQNSVRLSELPQREHVRYSGQSVQRRQRAFGYSEEDLKILLAPMANTGKEPLGAMGNDTPLAALSSRSRMLFDYFTQKFAQVTNPPLDWERERIVTSLTSAIGPETNLLDDAELSAKKIVIDLPVVTSDEMAQLKRLDKAAVLDGYYKPYVVRGLYQVAGGGQALKQRLEEIYAEVDSAIEEGKNFIVLSDRDTDHMWAPIPSLLLTSAVQHHLLETKTRTKISMAVEAGDVREVHHVALLIAYGAACVNPYMAFESVEELSRKGYVTVDEETAVTNLKKALSTGVLKIMSKMGVSTIMSYRGAQLFEAVGLSREVIDSYFAGTVSQVGGVGLDELAEEVAIRHRVAYPAQPTARPHMNLDLGGQYHWRRTGEDHLNDPEAIFLLQQATQRGDYEMFKRYTQHVNDNSNRIMTLRGLMKLKSNRPSIPLDEVEPASEIVKRFSTGAMSYGSISQEAHETLAQAMNAIGARSNSGEGGEDPERLNDPQRVSRIKQIASARFGVTSNYLVHATDLQIKLAQGAKPGEGGHLPGAKVPPWIAKVRHATPGVELISPPPHHDIYSIEDLKQLINDAKNANPQARVHVKLVSEFGVGTVAAGVAKCHADVVLISGFDGGTGAAPLNAIKHAGTPWEIGLAETQQTLILNNLRSRITVQCDGELKTGRDVVVAALLGAEEFGFATAALIVEGCIMMRVCNLNTCPQGIATQDPELRRRYTGKPEHVINFFMYIAEEVREILAELGFHTLEEAVGHVECLDRDEAVEQWKSQGIDLTNVLAQVGPTPGTVLHKVEDQDHELDKALDNQLIEYAQDALECKEPVRIELPVRNVNRTLGTMLGYEITKRYGEEGLPTDTIDMTFHGSAGQSVAAFIPSGETIRIYGEVNDYAGKGLSGGRLIVRPEEGIQFNAHTNVIAGNVTGFGATSGELFVAGRAGERFGVRNGGATMVVEGTGDHACEYMTGGNVMILGSMGRNFGAGFSGGHVYVLDLDMKSVNPAAATNGTLIFEKVRSGSKEAQFVEELLTKYAKETSSSFAEKLVEQLKSSKETLLSRFTHVVPRQFVAMQEAMEEAEKNHVDFNESGVWESVYERVVEGVR